MAVPPVPQSRTATAVRAARVPLLLDIVIGLLIAAALPLAVVAIPNTISLVATLLPPGISHIDMMRMHGLALPAMLLTVPLAMLAVRRFRAAPMAVAGLIVLALADVAGGYANSVATVGVLRALHGVGAGVLVTATLAAVYERPRWRILLAIWGAALAASMVTAQALALWPLDGADSWRITLQPYPLLTGVALVLAAAYLVLWLIAGDARRDDEDGAAADSGSAGEDPAAARRRLVVVCLLGVVVAALSVGMSFGWPWYLVIAGAVAAVIVLLAFGALLPPEPRGGRTPAFAALGTGLVILPATAQVTIIELRGVGGPGLKELWIPFAVAAVVALGAAIGTALAPESLAEKAPSLGLVAVVAGLAAIRIIVPSPSGAPLTLPFALLAAGAAVTLLGAFRLARPGSALAALALCLGGVLAGFLLGTAAQVYQLMGLGETVPTKLMVVNRFVEALHLWALATGFVVVAIIVLTALLARRSGAATAAAAGPEPARGDGEVVIPAPTRSPEEGGGLAGGPISDR